MTDAHQDRQPGTESCDQSSPQLGDRSRTEHPHSVTDTRTDDLVAGIIAEFSQVFAFARTRWSRYAEEVHPDLRGVGMMILQTIIRRGSITATELSQLMDMDKSVISRQVSRLRDLDLIEARPAEEDRRVILLSATPSAESTIEALRSKTAHAYHERFTGWSDDDLDNLNTLLHRFNMASPAGPTSPARRTHRDEETP